MPASFKFSSDTQGMVAPIQKASTEIRAMQKELYNARQAARESFQAQALEAKAAGASSEDLRKLQQKQFQELLAINNAHKQLSATYVSGGKQQVSAEEATRRASDAVTESLKQQRAEVEKLAAANRGGDHVGATRQQKASAILRGGGLRAGEAFAATIPGFDALASVAFPVAGVLALTKEIGHGVEAFIEMRRAGEEAAREIRAGFETINAPLETSIDTIRRGNAELEITIAKLEHKPANLLKLALADTVLELDRVADRARNAYGEVSKLLKEQKVSALQTLVTGNGSTNPAAILVQGGFRDVDNLSRDQKDAARQYGADSPQFKAASQALKERRTKLIEEIQARQKEINSTQEVIENQSLGSIPNLVKVRRSYEELHGNQDANRNIYSGALDILNNQDDEDVARRQQAGLQQRQKQDESNKQLAHDGAAAARKALEEQRKAAADQRKLWEDQHAEFDSAGNRSAQDEIQFWVDRANSTKVGSENWLDANKKVDEQIKRANVDRQHLLDERLKMNETFGRDGLKELGAVLAPSIQRSSQGNVDAFRTAGDLKQAQDSGKFAVAQATVQYQLQAGAISKADAAVQMQTLHTLEYEAAVKRLQDQYKGVQDGPEAESQRNAINTKYTEEQAKHIAQMMQDQAAVAGGDWFDALKKANAQWLQDTQDTAKQAAEIYTSLMGGVNRDIATSISEIGERGHRHRIGRELSNAVGGTVRGVGGQLVQNGLQRAEAGIMRGFGVGGKADGSKSNPFSVFVMNQDGKVGEVLPPGAASGVSKLVSGSDIGGSAQSFASAALSFLPGGSLISGLFGGGRAIGGGVKAGTTYLVGENGPELFSPGNTGYISTADKTRSMLSSGGDTHFNVDARGSNDPAAVRAQVMQGIREAAPHIVAASRTAQKEEKLRSPRGY